MPHRTSTLIPLVLTAAALLTGCYDPLSFARSESWLLRTGRYDIIEGLELPRTYSLQGCGAQALAAAFKLLDPSVDAQAECETLPFNERGASAIDILLSSRARGWRARVSKGTWDDLRQYVAERRAVLLMFDRAPVALTPGPSPRPVKVMHWGLLSGMSRDGREVLTAAPEGKHFVIKRNLFEERWATAAYCTVEINAPDGSG
jgi:hypothetical protein